MCQRTGLASRALERAARARLRLDRSSTSISERSQRDERRRTPAAGCPGRLGRTQRRVGKTQPVDLDVVGAHVRRPGPAADDLGGVVVAAQAQVGVVVEDLPRRSACRSPAGSEPRAGASVSPSWAPGLDLARPRTSSRVSRKRRVEVVPPGVAGEVGRVERVPAQVAAQARAARRTSARGSRARLEHLAVEGLDPHRAVVEDGSAGRRLGNGDRRAPRAHRSATSSTAPPRSCLALVCEQQPAGLDPAADACARAPSARARRAPRGPRRAGSRRGAAHWAAISHE